MPQISRKVPYLETEITALQSRIDIENLLNEMNIKDVRWTHLAGDTSLEFIWHFEEKGVKKSVAFKLKPPMIEAWRRRDKNRSGAYTSGPKIKIRAENAEWRLMWWWLKSKLEAVRFGLESMEQALMSQVQYQLPDGRITTIGEILSEAIKSDQSGALRTLPGMVEVIPTDQRALPSKVITINEDGSVSE